jgi:hypothetical protein
MPIIIHRSVNCGLSRTSFHPTKASGVSYLSMLSSTELSELTVPWTRSLFPEEEEEVERAVVHVRLPHLLFGCVAFPGA